MQMPQGWVTNGERISFYVFRFEERFCGLQELNSAADFNDIYQQLLPLVQTLPQLLFYKDTVVECLLSHVHLSAALSLEPILR
jgi:hypothetical protein